MLPRLLEDRPAALTDELLETDGVEAAFLAAILTRAQQALASGSIGPLWIHIWTFEPPSIECGPCPHRPRS
jgi:hypothetical protein